MKCIILILFTLTILTSAKPPLNPYEAVMKKKSIELGLYDSSDKVVILTSANFNDEVLHKNRSSLVEFYNSYCGHCKRFAPVYKMMAKNLYGWRDYIMIGAIDCAAEENSDICREYEIMGYPSLRYMASNFTPAAKHYGIDIESQAPIDIKKKLANLLLEEHPNLQSLTVDQAQQVLVQKTNKTDVYNFVILEPENSTVGIQTQLHFLPWPQVKIWHTSDQHIADIFGLNTDKCIANIVEGTTLNCTGMQNNLMATLYASRIEDNLKPLHVTPSPEPTPTLQLNATNVAAASIENASEIIAHVKSKKHVVYQADLEMAVHTILTTEIPRAAAISGEKLLALKRILAVIKRYEPLSKYGSGNKLVAHMYNFMADFPNNLNGHDFGVEIHRMQEQLPKPIFITEYYVGCLGSHPNSRGFSCSLWQLFHYLTVQAATNNYDNEGPLEVLQAIHGYVKHFFGCTDCSQHFQEMAVRRNIWDVASKDNAVIWLWSAHNEVNNRLKGDITEDAEFPKRQFPSEESCKACYQQTLNNPTEDSTILNTTGINWNKSAVLSFLKNIHNPENISLYGIKYLNISSGLDQMRHKRMITNAFSDLDMRVAMLLYAFCIVMIVLAFKLFVFKGIHRRKNYAPNELLGKV